MCQENTSVLVSMSNEISHQFLYIRLFFMPVAINVVQSKSVIKFIFTIIAIEHVISFRSQWVWVIHGCADELSSPVGGGLK